ncbi:polysaccharide deacetylase family protein [Thermoclostridium stercorarium]|jgi:peptidoglycan/xylan/chitin deacetylase (PgdA/CDA1 family)|uniref:Chitin deacetylase n=1 Tax=Thermoclostridium stercorarium subsp. leptospartum DSM 9219 TaxID=1346611 RepID=A0A1B1YN47_THEST|nr:polysaccharide deacetylase family protein [Thermoclostridium stercorarium]ANX02207.1 chitin deacetylase [Thermoclostridium stercorarium subsp. leptospartum DSM 9219]UZQ85283.1 polysaccharide deacetylase family protein [Thermoclostridium stercorarium]
MVRFFYFCLIFFLMITLLSGCKTVTVSRTMENEENNKVSSPETSGSALPETESNAVSETDANKAEPTAYPEFTPSPAAGLSVTVTRVPTPVFTPTPAPEPVSGTSPAQDQEKAASELMYPVKSFNDETRICLTFDDGGNQKAVKKVLEVLKKHNVKGTFFIIGKYLKTHADLWKQAVEEGHIICNHTQNHVWLTRLSNDEAKKEITEWEANAAEVLGQEYIDRMKREFPFIRLPGGAGNDSDRILKLVSEMGYIPVGWNLESYYAVLRHHDLKTESVDLIAEEVLEHISKKVTGGSIVLLHFNPYDTSRLDDIISAIKEKGLTMHLLSECLDF